MLNYHTLDNMNGKETNEEIFKNMINISNDRLDIGNEEETVRDGFSDF